MFSSWNRAMRSRHFCRVPGRAGPREMGRISPDGEGAMHESSAPQGHRKASHWVRMEKRVLRCCWNARLFKVVQEVRLKIGLRTANLRKVLADILRE